MGGIGSGRGFGWNRKATTETVKRLDIRFMRKQGFLEPGGVGALQWRLGGRLRGDILFRGYDDKLVFHYRVDGEDEAYSVKQEVALTRTPCHFGGTRLWFSCPCCHKRVGLLYAPQSNFKCRLCHKLPYASQQQGAMDNAISQKHQLGERIFENYKQGRGSQKRKGLHWKTFHRLHIKYQSYEQRWCHSMLRYLDQSVT
ncbi:hypothetical protein [Neptunomonas qingdaonensis]|uniref:Uncharacterized protein n=1 Tax=Neptunomonas qingdaonensis TaxID=1045558 RepID=A0A1I2N2Q9_9GAMM|nr:hypothetical protein [Neptunomonas qingdaonensis]SFF97933.1 hypothetical protein SAMN05216175_102252 [Neptunomonas qingdaonensis]